MQAGSLYTPDLQEQHELNYKLIFLLIYLHVIEKAVENLHGGGKRPVIYQISHRNGGVGVRHCPIVERDFSPNCATIKFTGPILKSKPVR